MKKTFTSLFIVSFLVQGAVAQNMNNNIRPAALGVSFILNDYSTAQRIRTGSLAHVFRDHSWAKFGEMGPGLALSYFKGLSSHIDFAGTLSGSFVNYSLPNQPASSNDNFLLEGDASINLKLLPDSYWFTPYASVGVGVSRYTSNFGAFVPLGAGLKLNLFDEASLFVNTQYRIPVTSETAAYHLMYSIGVSGVIGNSKH